MGQPIRVLVPLKDGLRELSASSLHVMGCHEKLENKQTKRPTIPLTFLISHSSRWF